MSIPLFKFPYLALDNILKQMQLRNVYDFAALSKRAFMLIQRSFFNVRLEFYFEWNSLLRVSYPCQCFESNFFEIKLNEISELETPMEENRINTFRLDKKLAFNSTLDQIASLFPKLTCTNEFLMPSDAEDYTTKMRQFKRLNLSLDYTCVGSAENKADNELVIAALSESHVISFLVLEIPTAEDFKLEICRKVSCGSITIKYSKWVTKDNVINAFMDCQIVELEASYFKDEEVREIMEKWVQGSLIEELTFLSNLKTLSGIFADFEGAVPVKKAMFEYCAETYKSLFRKGQCYKIFHENGAEAIVFVWNGELHLRAEYKLEDHGRSMWTTWKYDEDGPDVDDN